MMKRFCLESLQDELLGKFVAMDHVNVIILYF